MSDYCIDQVVGLLLRYYGVICNVDISDFFYFVHAHVHAVPRGPVDVVSPSPANVTIHYFQPRCPGSCNM
jgi:hypothetical protein